MMKWLRKLIFPTRDYFYGLDWGTVGEETVFVEGYKDRKGRTHITKVDVIKTNI